MTPNLVGQITLLVDMLRAHENARDAALAQAEEQSKLAAKIAREDLPELLREVEIEELTLSDGTKVRLKEKVTASITAERRAAAHAWLIENNFGGLIKTHVDVAFDATQRDEAARLGEELSERFGSAVEVEMSVHANTLKAFVKEQQEAGTPVPADLFGVFVYSEVEVKTPKRR